MIQRILLVLFIASTFLETKAQKFSSTLLEQTDWWPWHMPTGINMAAYTEYAYSYQKSAIYLNDNEAVVSVWHSKIGCALMRVSSDMKVKWQTPIGGYILGTSRWKDNFIVFYTKDWDSEKFGQKTIKQVHAMVIEPEKGKKLQDKVVYTNTSERFIEPIILSNSANQFGQLLIRHSNYGGRLHDQKWTTTTLNIITLNDQLQPSEPTSIPSGAITGKFLGAILNNKGEVFVATNAGNKLLVEKFGADLSRAGRLESEADGDIDEIIIQLNRKNEQSLIIAVTGMRQKNRSADLYDFDFVQNKVINNSQMLDRAFGKTLEARNKEQGEEVANFGGMLSMRLAALVQTEDKFVVILEDRIAMPRDKYVMFYAVGPGMIFFYDHKLKSLSGSAIKKNYELDRNYVSQWSVGTQVVDGKLLIVTNDGTKTRNKSVKVVVFDLGTMKAQPPFYTAKGEGTAEPEATLWFKNNMVLSRFINRIQVSF